LTYRFASSRKAPRRLFIVTLATSSPCRISTDW
jgi:hypothetical protein